jgi:hypothetical protein
MFDIIGYDEIVAQICDYCKGYVICFGCEGWRVVYEINLL